MTLHFDEILKIHFTDNSLFAPLESLKFALSSYQTLDTYFYGFFKKCDNSFLGGYFDSNHKMKRYTQFEPFEFFSNLNFSFLPNVGRFQSKLGTKIHNPNSNNISGFWIRIF